MIEQTQNLRMMTQSAISKTRIRHYIAFLCLLRRKGPLLLPSITEKHLGRASNWRTWASVPDRGSNLLVKQQTWTRCPVPIPENLA
jgi:hypothetical protein